MDARRLLPLLALIRKEVGEKRWREEGSGGDQAEGGEMEKVMEGGAVGGEMRGKERRMGDGGYSNESEQEEEERQGERECDDIPGEKRLIE